MTDFRLVTPGFSGTRYDYPPEFDELWAIYPSRSGGNPKVAAFKAYRSRIRQGYVYEDILSGLQRYADYCDATNRTGTEYVKQGATFFGPDEWFLEDWHVSSKERLPADDNELVAWGTQRGLPPKIGESFFEYRQRLTREAE